MLRVILAKSFGEARRFLQDQKDSWVAIETEYGDFTIDETIPAVDLSLNHHGDLQHLDAPALAYKKDPKRYDNFIISHIDLDVLFGILWTAGWLKKTHTTKKLSWYVAYADLIGFPAAKSLIESKEEPALIQRYLAIGYLVNSWVIHDNGQHLVDVSKEIHKLLLRIKDIILEGATKEQIALYEEWFKQQEIAAKKHLQEIRPLCNDENMFVFRAPFNLSSAYTVGNIEAKIIIQYNEQSKSISLSCFDDDTSSRYFGEDGVIKPLQEFFGNGAGGKRNIGGTPRDIDIQPEMLPAFIEYLEREYFNKPEISNVEEIIKENPPKTIIIEDKQFTDNFKKVVGS